MKILSKVSLRNDPMYRSSIIPLTESDKDIIFDKWFKGSILTGSLANDKSVVTLCKAKSARTLSIDTIEVSKVEVTQVVNNCGLDAYKCYLRVIKQSNGGLNKVVEFYNIVTA